jgi:hypothetical protein
MEESQNEPMLEIRKKEEQEKAIANCPPPLETPSLERQEF